MANNKKYEGKHNYAILMTWTSLLYSSNKIKKLDVKLGQNSFGFGKLKS